MSTKPDYSSLKALFINCTLKKAPIISHTNGLIKVSANIMEKAGVSCEYIRAVEYDIPEGVYPDMTEHGSEKDDFPEIFEKVLKADILVLGTPIWLGEKSSVCQKIIGRLYGNSSLTNSKGQYIYYGKVGGCIITGNEDGVKHSAMGIFYMRFNI